MLDDDFACRELTEAVREVLDAKDMLASKRHEQLFVTLVRNQQRRRQKKRQARIGLGIAAIAAAAALIFSVALALTPGDLRFKVGSAATSFVSGEPGAWVQADASDIEILFEQGSRFRVQEGCAARVVESGEEAVTIELSQGDIFADVKGNKKTNWRITAGPFTVTVLGTAFDVSWDAATNALDVNVRRGVVLVQGAGLRHHGVRLFAGQQLAANGRSGDVSLTSPAVGQTSPMASAVANTGHIGAWESERATDFEAEFAEGSDDASDLIMPKKPQEKPHAYRSVKRPWVVHYREGRFAEAVLAAEKEGLSTLYRTADAQTLWNLADAARNARRVSVSNDSLIALRRRFPAGNKAKLAAFIIGRSAMDVAGNATVAAQWFQTYLSESPNGDMTEEVYGRLMTIYTRTNRSAAAKRIASKYLIQYPKGLYAARAKQVLQ
ncbi:MAG: FecR domain-containing protein [Deltaproteobacteria bacterium]|nr:FecR domain-containing protein [Deltaproteobacteria bacterium]